MTINITQDQEPESAEATTFFGLEADELVRYIYIFSASFGVWGVVMNVASFLTSLALPNAKSTSALLIRYVAVWDNVALSLASIDLGINRLAGVGFTHMNSAMCKLFVGGNTTIRMTAMYHIVAMAIDRVIAIRYPIFHRNRIAANVQKSVAVTCAVVMFFCFICCSPLFFFMTIGEDGKCQMVAQGYPALMEISVIFRSFVINLGLSHVSFAAANIIFVQSLLKRTNAANAASKAKPNNETGQQSTSTAVDEKARRKERNNRNYIIMLILLTVSCSAASIIIGTLNTVSKDKKAKGEMDLSKVLKAIIEIPKVFNNSLNFVFYCISGEMFRKAFVRAFFKCGKKGSNGASIFQSIMSNVGSRK